MIGKYFFISVLCFMLFISITSQAVTPQELSATELARLMGLYDYVKVSLSEPSFSLQIEVFRNENPVSYENLDPDFVAEPVETIDVGKMEVYPKKDEKTYLLFAFQRLPSDKKPQNIIHWGIKTEGPENEGMGHSSFKLDLPEFDKPEYNWTFGLFPNPVITSEDFSPIYLIQGMEKQNGVTTFSGFGRDDINTQAQLYNILIVVKGSL